MKIIGIDPGVTTGICIYDSECARSSGYDWQFMQLGPTEHHEDLWDLLLNEFPHVIVCESFSNRGKAAVDLIPREYIGVVKFYKQHIMDATFDYRELIMQSPSQAKAFWTNDKLKACSLWKGTGLKHAMDATRHVLYYLMTKQLLPEEYLSALRDFVQD